MKKVFKIIGACFLMCGVIALIVCMCAIPDETKLFFDSVFDYLDRPIVLCGVSITLGGVLLYFIIRYILNNTSVGKKLLNALEKKIDDNNKAQDKKLEDVNKVISVYNHNTKEEIKIIKRELVNVKGAVSLFPNKKVQEALNNGAKEEKIG